jgi:hypothetical protein
MIFHNQKFNRRKKWILTDLLTDLKIRFYKENKNKQNKCKCFPNKGSSQRFRILRYCASFWSTLEVIMHLHFVTLPMIFVKFKLLICFF